MCTLGLANPRKKKRIPPAFWCGYPQLFGLVVMEKRRPVIGRASDAALVRRCRNRLRSSAHWSPRGGGQWLTAAGWLAAGCFRGPDVLCGRCCYRDTLRNTRACPPKQWHHDRPRRCAPVLWNRPAVSTHCCVYSINVYIWFDGHVCVFTHRGCQISRLYAGFILKSMRSEFKSWMSALLGFDVWGYMPILCNWTFLSYDITLYRLEKMAMW